MGFLDSYFRLTDMTSKQIDTDVAGSLSTMQAQLDGLNASMSAQANQQAAATDPATRLRMVDATATVNSAQLTGASIGTSSLVQLQLLVMLPGGIPMPVAHTAVVDALNLARLQPGAQLSVRLDPANPSSLTIEWTR